jgi:hypothetical protein
MAGYLKRKISRRKGNSQRYEEKKKKRERGTNFQVGKENSNGIRKAQID